MSSPNAHPDTSVTHPLEPMLRDAFGRRCAGPVYSVGAMIAGARHRRHQRLALRAVTLVAVISVSLAAYAVTAVRSRAVGPAGPTAVPTASQVPGYVRPLLWAGVVNGTAVAPVGGSFVDADHGYLLFVRCELHDEIPCVLELRATVDAGKTWTVRSLPPVANHGEIDPLLVAAGPDLLVYRGYASFDGGRAWRELTTFTQVKADALPAEAVIFSRWSQRSGRWEQCALGSDGVLYVLSTSADSIGFLVDPAFERAIQVPDGSIFLAGVWRGAGQRSAAAPDLRASRDGGRSWQALTAPFQMVVGPDGARYSGSLLTIDGRLLYYVSSFGSYDTDGVQAIYRSDDGGASWRSVGLPPRVTRLDQSQLVLQLKGFNDRDDSGEFISAALGADGSLLVTRAGRLYRLAAASTSYEAVDVGFGGLHVIQTGEAVLGVDVREVVDADRRPKLIPVFGLTRDGLNWTEIVLA